MNKNIIEPLMFIIIILLIVVWIALIPKTIKLDNNCLVYNKEIYCKGR